MFTTLSGSVLATIGIISLMLQIPAWQSTVHSALNNAMVVPLLVVVPAVIGFVVQQQIGGFSQLREAQAGGDD